MTEPIRERVLADELAFPHNQELPTEFSQSALTTQIAETVCAQLRPPEIEPGFWQTAIPAAGMSMPETAVHEDHLSRFRKHNVRAAGQIGFVEPISKAETPQKPAGFPLRLRVLVPDPAHAFASFERGQSVHVSSRMPERINESGTRFNR